MKNETKEEQFGLPMVVPFALSPQTAKPQTRKVCEHQLGLFGEVDLKPAKPRQAADLGPLFAQVSL